ncbi:hypothetical protein CLCR_05849 [Cladophialophora carrionii]|uniref:Transcription factor domain-containing protein n=1 Tax=Cladophialophora carrionii TaxID=86049 RepID=A0A1C1C8C4_9EURO|nr:hypothetical protein CLCR_05849 [Cladophialophora carrionii]
MASSALHPPPSALCLEPGTCPAVLTGIVWSQPSQTTTLSESPANDTVGGSTTADGEHETSNLLARLKQLEEAVFSQKPPKTSSEPIHQADHCDFQSHSMERDHGLARRPPHAPESTGTDVNAYVLVGTPSSPQRPPAVSELVDILPSLFDARSLFAFYVENLNWYLPIIHVPTTCRAFEQLYKCLQDGTQPDWPQISLLAAILSVAVYFWQDSTTGNAPCPVKDPKACCKSWVILVQRALAEANHLICPLLETLQAKVLLTLFLPTYPQNTGRRGQVALLITEAHILQLHRVDSPSQRRTRENSPTLEAMVRLEVQRRVWWVIVMSDW